MTHSDDFPFWLGLRVPRYTSYPAANHFTPEVNNTVSYDWLSQIKQTDTVSIYVHIPFCRELCWFCGCHTKITKKDSPIEFYVDSLLKEIDLLKQSLQEKGILKNIHFGGGSPSVLSKQLLNKILKAINSIFLSNQLDELAIELDPRTTTDENIKFYAESGFNRVSLGLQDFDPIVQKAINRIQSYELVDSIINKLHTSGISAINVDLVYGLPHQTILSFKDTLLKVLMLNPSRIALFSYAHIPDFKKHQRLINTDSLPTEEDKLKLYLFAQDFLIKNNYVAIGIDHFAKSDDPLTKSFENKTLGRNFQGYMINSTDLLLGIGVSAISQFKNGYVQNSTKIIEYKNMLEQNVLPVTRGFVWDKLDVIYKDVIDELMCNLSVDLDKICNNYNLSKDFFYQEINILKKHPYNSILTFKNNIIYLNTNAYMAIRVIASIFDKYLIKPKQGSYSKIS